MALLCAVMFVLAFEGAPQWAVGVRVEGEETDAMTGESANTVGAKVAEGSNTGPGGRKNLVCCRRTMKNVQDGYTNEGFCGKDGLCPRDDGMGSKVLTTYEKVDKSNCGKENGGKFK